LLFRSTIGGVQMVGGLAILTGVLLMLSAGGHRRVASIANPLLFYLPRGQNRRKKGAQGDE